MTPPLSPVRSNDGKELSVGRTKRIRRPNVKYALDEYDLSLASVFCPWKLMLPRMMSKQTKSKRWK